MTALWRQLIDKTQHEVLFDGVLFPWVIEWMCAMSQSKHRGVRHTGTEAAAEWRAVEAPPPPPLTPPRVNRRGWR